MEPLVKPEKKASAIEQKKKLLEGTSVNGSVMLEPPHVPVSARRRLDAIVIMNIKPITNAKRDFDRPDSFTGFLQTIDACSLFHGEVVGLQFRISLELKTVIHTYSHS